jgi:rhodanese-related sulfurtransferase
MSDIDPVREVSAQALKAMFDDRVPLELIDCRQPEERELTHIGGRLVPLPELPARLAEEAASLAGKTVIVYCRSGRRSLDFVDALRRAGVDDARSLAGGINHWNTVIDPDGVRY